MFPFLLSLLLIAVSIALLSVRLFVGKSFVRTHTSQNKAMRERGIGCVQSQDAAARRSKPTAIHERRKP